MVSKKSKDTVKTDKEVQDWIAKYYPKRYSGTGFLYHSRIVNTMLQDITMKQKVLDVGCGIGFVSQLYPNFNITGIDISEEMLKRNPFKWQNMDAEAMSFKDESFNLVVCRSLLHHLEVPQKGMNEMARVLKTGGNWVCWETNNSIITNIFRAAAKHTDRFSHLHRNFNIHELEFLIKASGLTITEVRYIGYLAYPLIAFPDIININLPIEAGKFLMNVDDIISKTPLRRLAWSVLIRAQKK